MPRTWPYEIALSRERKYRRWRHAIFWFSVFTYQTVRIALFFPLDKIVPNAREILTMSFLWGVLPNVWFTVVFSYFLVPRFYQQHEYLLFGICCVLLMVSMEVYALIIVRIVYVPHVTIAIGTSYESNMLGFWSRFRPGMIRVLGNPPLICGFFVGLRTMKGWYLEQMQNLQLARERARAEHQLLKAQVHPHFLFNTLNNIYAFALDESVETLTLVEKLTDLLHYMVYDCNGDFVPLVKELKLLEDYVGLEKVRYGDRLELLTNIRGDWRNKTIAPMLLIPFVENSFKHGSSVGRGRQWVHLNIEVNDDKLHFKIANSKPPIAFQRKTGRGIGLQNVRKRLDLIYPGNHLLDIHSSEQVFVVELEVLLYPVLGDEKQVSGKGLVSPTFFNQNIRI